MSKYIKNKIILKYSNINIIKLFKVFEALHNPQYLTYFKQLKTLTCFQYLSYV